MSFPLPRPLSHSSISLFNECPQKYKFKYIDKIPEKPKYFFSFGQSVHLALEYFYGPVLTPAAPKAPSLEDLLKHFHATHSHLALVRDANENYVGLVTLEDVVEELDF